MYGMQTERKTMTPALSDSGLAIFIAQQLNPIASQVMLLGTSIQVNDGQGGVFQITVKDVTPGKGGS